MTKQEYLFAVIDAIPDWKMGRGLKTLIANNQLNEETIDKMVIIFKRAMDRISFYIKGQHVLEQLHASEHLAEQENAQAQQDAIDFQKLDEMLSTF